MKYMYRNVQKKNHRHYPTTDWYGGFDLLGSHPEPGNRSLGNLVVQSSLQNTIPTLILVQTPDRRSSPESLRLQAHFNK